MFRQLKLFYESLVFASHSVTVNKLRTILSLLGITIGIFSIISVFTIVDSLEINIRESLDSMGSNIIYIQKWPWTEEDGTDYKYRIPFAETIQEYLILRTIFKLVEYYTANVWISLKSNRHICIEVCIGIKQIHQVLGRVGEVIILNKASKQVILS